MPRDVHVDHDEIRTKTAQMTGVLDDLMGLRSSLEGIVDSMVKEASVATADGGPSPVFGPLINSSKAAVERLQKSLDAVHYRVQKDLEILNEMSASVQQQAEDSAQGINNSDQSFDRGSGGTTGGSGGTTGGSGGTTGDSGGSGTGGSQTTPGGATPPTTLPA